MARFLLIHGSWHGGWCWERVVPFLQKQGHEVIAPDLPAHGDDKTAVETVTLEDYVGRVTREVQAGSGPVILVGHSMGGVVVTQAAQWLHPQVQAVIYVTAFAPRDGESLAELRALGGPSRLDGVRRRVGAATWIAPEDARECFYHCCATADQERALTRLCLEPIAPAQVAVRIRSDGYGSIPRYYIRCAEDRAILPALQDVLLRRAGCELLGTLATDHSPFYSDPYALSELLLKVVP